MLCVWRQDMVNRPDADPQSVRALVDTLVQQSPHKQRYQTAAVINAWNEHLPPNLQGHVRCSGFKDHTLYAVAETATFKHALLLMKKQLLAKLQTTCGEGVVKAIVIR